MAYDYTNDPKAPHGFVRNQVEPAPAEQQGVKAEYPGGYNGPAFRWLGALSQIVAAGNDGVKFKIAEGFLPRRYFVKCHPIVDTVHEGLTKTLVAGDNVSLAVTGDAGSFTQAVTASDGSDSDSDADAPLPFYTGAVTSPALVTNDETWATVKATVTTLEGDALVEIGFYAEQADPNPPKQF